MDVDDSKYFGLCKCCLRDGCFRSLWVDYAVGGVLHNYGEMINECFALNWEKPGNELLDQICDRCTQRVKAAHSFRKQLLASHHQLNNLKLGENESEVIGDVICEDTEVLDEYIPVIKKEESYIDNDEYQPNTDTEYLNDPAEYPDDPKHCLNDPNDYPNDPNDPTDYAEDPDDPDYQVDPQDTEDSDNPNYVDDADGSQDGLKEEYEDIEYLDIDGDAQESVAAPALPAPPQAKKKRRGGRRVYKNYTIDDLQQSVDATMSGRMSAAEAAVQFNVPRKTIAAKILSEKRGGLTSAERSRRYREKLKRENPEKLEAQRLRNLQRIKSKKKKIAEMTHEEAEKRRKEWREEKYISRQKKRSSGQRIMQQEAEKRRKTWREEQQVSRQKKISSAQRIIQEETEKRRKVWREKKRVSRQKQISNAQRIIQEEAEERRKVWREKKRVSREKKRNSAQRIIQEENIVAHNDSQPQDETVQKMNKKNKYLMQRNIKNVSKEVIKRKNSK